MTKPPIHLETREAEGKRLYSPSAGRNSADISKVLSQYLPRGARVLEIASGTGEHAVHMCGVRDDIIWQPSDPDAASRASQNAWASERPGQMLPSLSIDTSVDGWWDDFASMPFDAVYCANMIHIAPWEAALGLAKAMPHILNTGGKLALYGPFKEGEETAPSNLEFDENLKGRNLAWGVRDMQSVKHIFADVGFNMTARIVMPKENRILIFSK